MGNKKYEYCFFMNKIILEMILDTLLLSKKWKLCLLLMRLVLDIK